MPIPIYLILADEKKRNGEVLILQETPGGVLHGLAAPDWRGEICVGRTSMLTQKIDGEFHCQWPISKSPPFRSPS